MFCAAKVQRISCNWVAKCSLPELFPFGGAFGAKTFSHVVDAFKDVSLWQADVRYRNVAYAECAPAAFAEEVNVLVVVVFMAIGAMTDFISYSIASVLKNMNQVMLAQQ